MRKEMDEILIDLQLEKITLTDAGNKLLRLFSVMPHLHLYLIQGVARSDKNT